MDEKIETQKLKELAIWLEGLKKGQGNLHPLGYVHLEELHNAIKFINKNQVNN